jgi:signal transduction histidine kinase
VGTIPVTIVRVAVGVALGVFGVLLEVGLDRVVGVAPWLVVAFVSVLAAAILGGVVGGVGAAAICIVGQAVAIPAWVPAARALDAGGWRVDTATAVIALLAGLLLRRAVLSNGVPARNHESEAPAEPVSGADAAPRRAAETAAPAGEVDPVGQRLPAPPGAPSSTDLATLTAAIRDFGAVRTPIQVADALARHAAALTNAAHATVYLATPGSVGFVPMGRVGGIDPSAPRSLDAAAVDPASADAGNGFAASPADSSPILVPIVARTAGQTRPIGAIRLAGPSEQLVTSPLLRVVAQFAADALEAIRLESGQREAADGAAAASRRLAIVGRLAVELVGGRTIAEVSQTLLDFAVDDLRAGFATVHVAEPGGAFRLAGSRGYPAGLIAADRVIAAGTPSPVTRAAESRDRVDLNGEDGWRAAFPRTSNVPAITGVRAITAVPMVAAHAVHGVLTIGWRTPADRSGADHGMLAGAAAQGAQALERAILHAQDEEARRFQEAFIGVVSHELRTPITTILAGSRLLSRRVEGNAAAADLSQDIEIEADRLTRIVDDLLVLSRLERHHLTIGDDPVHLDHLLARVVRSESARWPSHRFEPPTSPNRHVVLGEETYVEQVLRNLISNAAKYSPAGSTIRITIDDAADGDVEVRVLDEGPGIAPAEVDDLFTLFYRSASTSASAAGAGIGLFVSRQLVTEMGGRIWARPRPGGGSEFGFSLAPYPIDELERFDDEPPTGRTVIPALPSERV